MFTAFSAVVIGLELFWWAALYAFPPNDACADCEGPGTLPLAWVLPQLLLVPLAALAGLWLIQRGLRRWRRS